MKYSRCESSQSDKVATYYKVEQLKIENDIDGVRAAKLFKWAVSHAMGFDPANSNLIDRPLEEYIGKGLFVINDHSCAHKPLIIAGGAVLDGGFIASVFKDHSYSCTENYRSVLPSLITAMTEYGGDRLVCKGDLAKIYMSFGFMPVAHATPGVVKGKYLPEKFYFYKPKENEKTPKTPERFETYEDAFQYLKGFSAKKRKLGLPTSRSHFIDGQDLYID